jgi:4'-phosphopantetheinyl transferase EntD
MTPFNIAIDLPPAPIMISHLLMELVPVDAVAYETHSLDTAYPLMAEEVSYVATSVPKRIREFSAGRACARAALRQLHIEDFPILAGAHREPIWPAAFAGSITHTKEYAGAIVVSKDDGRSVGIDAAREGSVGEDLWREICSPLELKWLHGLTTDTARTAASIIFSAKEAFYKAQFPLTGEWLDFHDVQISIDDRGFRVSPLRALRLQSIAPAWEGRFHVTCGLVLTAICIR